MSIFYKLTWDGTTMILKDCLFSVSKLESYVQNIWQGAANWILTIHWIMGKLDSNALPHTITHWWLRRTYKYNHTQHTYCYILHVYCNTIRIIKWYFWRHFSTNPNICPFVHLSAFQRQVQSWKFSFEHVNNNPNLTWLQCFSWGPRHLGNWECSLRRVYSLSWGP